MTATRGRRPPQPGAGYNTLPDKPCPSCPERFYTQTGLDEHLRIGDHHRVTRRWVTGRFSPAGMESLTERGRQIAAANNARRRRCSCGRVSTPAGVGIHQKRTGHTGWEDAPV